MQCEKLHNLHNTAYFTVTFFALKIDNILNDQISTLQKNGFLLVSDERVFFLFITRYVLFKKNKMQHSMQREKLYNFQRTVYIICAACVFKSSKILSTRFSTVTKFCTNEDFLFSYFIFLSINMLS